MLNKIKTIIEDNCIISGEKLKTILLDIRGVLDAPKTVDENIQLLGKVADAIYNDNSQACDLAVHREMPDLDDMFTDISIFVELWNEHHNEIANGGVFGDSEDCY